MPDYTITFPDMVDVSDLTINRDPAAMSQEDREQCNKTLKDEQISIATDFYSSDEYINAFSRPVSKTMTQIPGGNIAFTGTTPNTLSMTACVQNTSGTKTRTIQTAYGAENETVFDQSSGVMLMPDIESGSPGGYYTRVSTSNMDFFSGANLTLQGNGSFMGMFPTSPVDFVCGKYSVFSDCVNIIGCDDVTIVGTSISLKASPQIDIIGNVNMQDNLQVGGSLNVMGELYAPHITTTVQNQLTTDTVGLSGCRINESSDFIITPSGNGVDLAVVSTMTGIINIDGLGTGTFVITEGLTTISSYILYSKIYSNSYMTGVPDVVGLEHQHRYKTPSFTECGSQSDVHAAGVEACTKVGEANADGEVLAEPSEAEASKSQLLTTIMQLAEMFNPTTILNNAIDYGVNVVTEAVKDTMKKLF